VTLEHLGESSLCRFASGGDSEASPMMGVVETKEVEDFPFMKEMALALEVSSVVGQAGLQEDCFKRIIAETHRKGGDSLHSTI
jgi:hypothetical protein